METLKIYLVRHGRTMMNTLYRMQGWCDSPLTPKGIANAQALGKGLTDIQFDSAYCSALRRTYQTAHQILAHNNQQGLPITELEGINEMCFGSLEAIDEKEAWNLVSVAMGFDPNTNQLDQALFGGEITMQEIYRTVTMMDTLDMAESWETVEARVYQTISNIAEVESAKNSKNILIVSHGNAIATFLMKLGCKEIPQKPIENLSISEITYHDKAFKIETVADLTRLEKGKTLLM